MTPTILLAGTWGNSRGLDRDAWWKPGSTFAEEGKRHGLIYPDEADPFEWCTGLDGLDAANSHWMSAAKALVWYCQVKKLERVNLIAHSHGGQVAGYASTLPGMPPIEVLMTVATPIRKDIVFNRAKIKKFIHLYGGIQDTTQLIGEIKFEQIGEFHLDLTTDQREMPLADKNICDPKSGHSDLHEATLWNAENWWAWLSP